MPVPPRVRYCIADLLHNAEAAGTVRDHLGSVSTETPDAALVEEYAERYVCRRHAQAGKPAPGTGDTVRHLHRRPTLTAT
jgi:hypothetical protein